MELVRDYTFDGIRLKKKQQKIVDLLKSCKEIRDTSYPLIDSLVTELEIIELHASKQKDFIYTTGTLLLVDNELEEKRSFVAYITEKNNEYHILLDITRLNDEKPKMIRTTDVIIEEENNIISHTSYCSLGFLEEKIFEEAIPKTFFEHTPVNQEQLSAF